jgi:hypothetical protein
MDTFFKTKTGKLYYGVKAGDKFNGCSIRDGKAYGAMRFGMQAKEVGWIVGEPLSHWSGREIPSDRLVRVAGSSGLCISAKQFLSQMAS